MKELLFSVTKKDFKISYFSGKGAGGQHRNRHKNCVRMTHPDSGASAVGQNERSKERNLRNAFKRITSSPKFKIWLNKRIQDLTTETIDDIVDREMKPENLLIETGW